MNNKRYAGLNKTNTENDVPFVTIKIEHGASPENENYGYVIMPCKTEQELAEYAENPDFEVLEQTDDRHVIRLYDGTIMANLFKPGELLGFMFKNPCSVILKPAGRGWTVYLSDPTQRLSTMMIGLPDGGSMSGQEVSIHENTAYISVNKDYGATYKLVYSPGTSGDIWSAESGLSTLNGDIYTRNMSLRIGASPISAKLYAKSKTGAQISYKLLNGDKLNGKAYVKGDRLYYIPNAEGEAEEQVEIEVTDGAGNTARCYISITVVQ